MGKVCGNNAREVGWKEYLLNLVISGILIILSISSVVLPHLLAELEKTNSAEVASVLVFSLLNLISHRKKFFFFCSNL